MFDRLDSIPPCCWRKCWTHGKHPTSTRQLTAIIQEAPHMMPMRTAKNHTRSLPLRAKKGHVLTCACCMCKPRSLVTTSTDLQPLTQHPSSCPPNPSGESPGFSSGPKLVYSINSPKASRILKDRISPYFIHLSPPTTKQNPTPPTSPRAILV